MALRNLWVGGSAPQCFRGETINVLRRLRALEKRTGRKAEKAWLDKALVELETATRTPCTLRFHRLDASGGIPADTAVDQLLPLLQGEGHQVVNVSGGGCSPITYVTVAPRHLAQSGPVEV